MTWTVDLHDDFALEFDLLPEVVQDELLAHIALLEAFEHQLGRPRADTLKGSRHANMKELRFRAGGGAWRFAFAFDPSREAIVLCGGNKSGGSEKLFYRQLLEKADCRFDSHLTGRRDSKRKLARRKARK